MNRAALIFGRFFIYRYLCCRNLAALCFFALLNRCRNSCCVDNLQRCGCGGNAGGNGGGLGISKGRGGNGLIGVLSIGLGSSELVLVLLLKLFGELLFTLVLLRGVTAPVISGVLGSGDLPLKNRPVALACSQASFKDSIGRCR